MACGAVKRWDFSRDKTTVIPDSAIACVEEALILPHGVGRSHMLCAAVVSSSHGHSTSRCTRQHHRPAPARGCVPASTRLMRWMGEGEPIATRAQWALDRSAYPLGSTEKESDGWQVALS
jgi:hypothetical protein